MRFVEVYGPVIELVLILHAFCLIFRDMQLSVKWIV